VRLTQAAGVQEDRIAWTSRLCRVHGGL
jgi:hypothetical protein